MYATSQYANCKKYHKNPYLDEEQGKIFVQFVEDEIEKRMATLLFIDHKTNAEVADEIGYATRHVERKRADIVKGVLRKLLNKHIPKKVRKEDDGKYHCECGAILEKYEACCNECGQALDWGDSE